MPSEYQRASLDFEKFMSDARDASDLVSTNQAYTMVQGVLQAFRRRLAPADAIRFAGVLPPVLRAVFVADWDMSEPQREFGDRAAMTREVQSLRAAHNFAPETAIRDVAFALRKNIDAARLDGVLAELPNGAREFWTP
jgi:uncharacterized protein (DUF2267 family)